MVDTEAKTMNLDESSILEFGLPEGWLELWGGQGASWLVCEVLWISFACSRGLRASYQEDWHQSQVFHEESTMNRDLPSFSSGSYGTATSVMNLATGFDNAMIQGTAKGEAPWETKIRGNAIRRMQHERAVYDQFPAMNVNQEKTPMATKRRFVQVFVVDPNDLIPLDHCVIYKGEPKLTDASDQELFFELDMKSLLETHNAFRVTVVDKRVKDRTEYLEPAKIRDLKMVVVNIAEF